MFQQKHTKIFRFLDINTLFFLSPLTSFFKGDKKVSKKLGKGRNLVRKSAEETKMRWDFSIFISSLLAIIVIDIAFKKSGLGKFILEKVLPGTSNNWPYDIQTCQFSVLNLNFHMFVL